MVRLIIVRLILPCLVAGILLVACGTNEGTETGNPQKAYSNTDQGVSAKYPSDWNVSEVPVLARDTASPCSDCVVSPMQASGIDTTNAPSTVFTDGMSTITLYYVTLKNPPASLIGYLGALFPSRNFVFFSNSSISGFTYDNPEAGVTGGDRKEYYFLKNTTLLYVVTDLFQKNDGLTKFDTLIQSLRFN